MAKFYGVIGYAEAEEVELMPGVWGEKIVERPFFGELIRNTRSMQNSGQVNDDINIANSISILADPFAYQNFHLMRYASYMGTKWKITNVEVQHPRLILTVGGVYNGK